MPCCSWVLSVVASSSGGAGTPSWLHRLHAKGGLSFPKGLQIDDLLYGKSQSPTQPTVAAPPPPDAAPLPPSPTPAAATPQAPPPKPNPARTTPARPNPSAAAAPQAPPPKPNPARTTPARPNPSAATTSNNKTPLPQQLPTPPPAPLSDVVSDIFAVTFPSAPRSTRLLKPFRKQSRPRPCDDDDKTPRSSTHENKEDTKTKGKSKGRKRRRAERDAALAAAANAAGERNSKTDVTVIDSSIDGWKGSKLLIRRGLTWKVQNKKISLVTEPEILVKGKRRAGLVGKIMRDKEKEKNAAASQGNTAISGDLVKEPDGATEMLKRPRSSEPAPGGQTAALFLLPSTSTLSQP